MNSDNYEFAKSSAPQSVDNYSSFTDKQFNNITDINNGVYSNNSGLTQVQFDLSSIYNSGGFTSTEDMFLTIPIVMTACYVSSAGAVVSLPALPAASVAGGLGGAAASLGGCAAYSLLSLKTNYQNLIHQIEIQADGNVISQTQPFVNIIQGFRMLSQMSTTDLNTWGPSLNYNGVIDSEKSMLFNMAPSTVGTGTLPATVSAGTTVVTNAVTYANVASVGMTNNIPFFAGVGGCPSQSSAQTAMNAGCVNTAIANRISRFADLTTSPASSSQGFWGTSSGTQTSLMSATQLANEYKPYVTYNSGAAGTLIYYDLAIIPLKYLCDCMDKIGLVRKLSAVMRLYLNTGSCSVKVNNAALQNQYFGPIQNSTFANTCPFTINNVCGLSAAIPSGTQLNVANVPTGCSGGGFICAGVFVSKAPTTAIPVGGGSINIGNGVGSHPMPSCRAYYSLVKMEPSRALAYVQENRNKLVIYEQFITNQYNAIPSGSSFSQLVQSGIKNPLSIIIIPLISSTQPITVGGSNALGFSQYGSCLDTCPTTFAPLSLTNLQVTLGGQNILNSTLFYTFENFLEQVALADTLTSSDMGIGAGLISQSWWENNRVYYVDLKRSRDADKAATRNLNISFTNNTNVVIDLLVFTTYLDKLVIDVESGLVKH